MIVALVAVSLLAPVAVAASQRSSAHLERTGVFEVGFPVAAWRVVRAPVGERIVWIGERGEVALSPEDGRGALVLSARPLGVLAHPAQALLDTGPWPGPESPHVLFAAQPAGLDVLALEPPGDDGLPTWQRISTRARFDLRTGEPVFAPFLDDVNGDGRPDVVLPAEGTVELWFAESEGGEARLVRAGRIRVQTTSSSRVRVEALSDRLSARFTIPHLATEDLDGDGRPDLIVTDGKRRAFHLQADDGAFPREPTVEVDLSLFRDPGASGTSLRFGGTLVVSDEAQMTRRDLDGDGRADFVLAHGRKVWVFHGGEKGPQFTDPSAILKTADDVTTLLIARLDDDPYPDLLLLRVEVPSIPTLLMGLFADWDVKVRATGYRNLDGRRFELRPSFTRDLSLRLPPIFDLLRDPYAVLERFQGVGRKFRPSLDGDFDGDGAEDLVLIAPEERRVDAWFGRGGVTEGLGRDEIDAILREQLFGDGPAVWDLERLAGWLETRAVDRERRLTAGRSPDASFGLRVPPHPEGAPAYALARAEVVRPSAARGASIVLEWVAGGLPPVREVLRITR